MNKEATIPVQLTGVEKTLLVPLWARARETRRTAPIVRDPQAASMVASIDYDFARFDSAHLTQWGIAVRTKIFDRLVQDFLDRHQRTCIINLGAGLDTRHARLRLRDTLWYELDLPASLALRRRFFAESEQYRFLAKSVFDTTWFDAVDHRGRAVLLIAEGLFMFFGAEDIGDLFAGLAKRFRGAEMLLEIAPPAIVGHCRLHDSAGKSRDVPEFKWGTADDQAPEKWSTDIALIDVWRFFDYHPERIGWRGWLLRLPFLRPYCEPRVVRLYFGPAEEMSAKLPDTLPCP